METSVKLLKIKIDKWVLKIVNQIAKLKKKNLLCLILPIFSLENPLETK